MGSAKEEVALVPLNLESGSNQDTETMEGLKTNEKNQRHEGRVMELIIQSKLS